MKIILYIVLLLISSTPVIPDGAEKIAIIVHKSVKDKVFDKNIISDIYTLNKQFWEDGSKVVVVDRKGEDKLKEEFYKRLNLSVSKLQRIWIRKQFSGKGQAPKTYKTQKEILSIIESTPGAIGYVSSDSTSDNVRIIATISI